MKKQRNFQGTLNGSGFDQDWSLQREGVVKLVNTEWLDQGSLEVSLLLEAEARVAPGAAEFVPEVGESELVWQARQSVGVQVWEETRHSH